MENDSVFCDCEPLGSKVYISGPITQSTEDDKGKAKFKEMTLFLHNECYIPISPRRHRVPPWWDFNNAEDQDKIWPYMMRLAIIDLMLADSCIMLDGWNMGSKGCAEEYRLCRMLDIPVYSERGNLILGDEPPGMEEK